MKTKRTKKPKVWLSPKNLRKLLEQLELTQDALARLLDVRRKTVSDWVNGRVPISKPVAMAISMIREEQEKLLDKPAGKP